MSRGGVGSDRHVVGRLCRHVTDADHDASPRRTVDRGRAVHDGAGPLWAQKRDGRLRRGLGSAATSTVPPVRAAMASKLLSMAAAPARAASVPTQAQPPSGWSSAQATRGSWSLPK